MVERRRFGNWFAGAFRGELSTSGLDGLRTVGASAYSLAEDADSVRLEPGWSVWTADVGQQLFLVCAWNAFALQTIADHVIVADAELAPESTLAFAQACYPQVLNWIEAARSAQASGAYRLRTALPAPLPPWPRLERTRTDHVRALQSAYDATAPRAESELGRVIQSAPVEHGRDVAEMRVLAAEMHTCAEFAGGLRSRAHSHEQLREACDELVRALGRAYTLGQVVAMPSLVERLQLAGYRAHPTDAVPVTAIAVGWLVVDRDGARVGTVTRLEGEPALGNVTGLVISVGAQSADRRVRLDQLGSVERGVVRLAAGKAELETA